MDSKWFTVMVTMAGERYVESLGACMMGFTSSTMMESVTFVDVRSQRDAKLSVVNMFQATLTARSAASQSLRSKCSKFD